jgi:hypothetical protein
MLQYDLTGTRLFHALERADLPGEAEMFVITTALLLYHDASYGSLSQCTLVFDESDLAGVAECIEYRLPAFVPDLGEGTRLRERLQDFVGIAIGCDVPVARRASSHPT